MAGCDLSFGWGGFDSPTPNGGRCSRMVGQTYGPGRSGSDNRRSVEAGLWIARQEVPGAIFRYSSATGTASSSATATG